MLSVLQKYIKRQAFDNMNKNYMYVARRIRRRAGYGPALMIQPTLRKKRKQKGGVYLWQQRSLH